MKPKFSDNALEILRKRYLWTNPDGTQETPEEMLRRVARVVASVEPSDERAQWESEFYGIMARLEFLPNSPTLMNAGKPDEHGQLSACFVVDVPDSMDGIASALRAQMLIHKSGGGTGFDFSNLRARGSAVGSTGGVASGPVSFMQLFNMSTDVVQQGGARRGANIALLNIEHADIRDFIHCKEHDGSFANFNISVKADDDFMQSVSSGDPDAVALFDEIAETAWRTGDPGMFFTDTVNRANPTPHLGRIEACNPCGEVGLYSNEACNLGSINVSAFYDHSKGGVDLVRLREVVRVAVRFLDNVIDVNRYPMPEITEAVQRTRKIGLGIMGWADLLFRMRIPYGGRESLNLASVVMGTIRETGVNESRNLAVKRGIYPGAAKGRTERNSTITCIAPTGTIGLLADCSSGIEPVFALEHTRRAFANEPGKESVLTYRNKWYEEAIAEADVHGRPVDMGVFVTAHDVTPENHIMMQAAFQEHVDLAVSKTVNLPHDATVDDVKAAYLCAWMCGCKGITVYRDGCRSSQPLIKTDDAPKKPVKRHEPAERPRMLSGQTMRLHTSYGNLFLTLNDDNGVPFEVFATLGKSGKDVQAHTEALGRLMSLALRLGGSAAQIIDQLRGISGSAPVWDGEGNTILSLPDAIAQGLLALTCGENDQECVSVDMCPGCGAVLVRAEGCIKCESCGYSKC